ncbi:hypothetical protein GIB67_004657 [Kingdonia uniflora]|uniref:No apical meristem-associated C-terminal domain-containing protein n=1 Tax=Kingdonia uniflora TaxID=39325 RepID=A0A7J7P566_9MAGN|nr:hypothetical protein GIB67_004657 [Kingdonia uniflora]
MNRFFSLCSAHISYQFVEYVAMLTGEVVWRMHGYSEADILALAKGQFTDVGHAKEDEGDADLGSEVCSVRLCCREFVLPSALGFASPCFLVIRINIALGMTAGWLVTPRLMALRGPSLSHTDILEFTDGERVERTVSSLKNHWSDMNCVCKVYGTCLKNMMQGPISGMQQGNLDDVIKMIYEARGKGKWVYKEAYEVLSCHQYWKILQDQHPNTLAHNVQMKQTSSSSPGMSTPATPDTPVSSNNESLVFITDMEMECPGGIKNVKLKEKNEKRQNLLIEHQNILISRIDLMEKKKEEYAAKRDKKKKKIYI